MQTYIGNTQNGANPLHDTVLGMARRKSIIDAIPVGSTRRHPSIDGVYIRRTKTSGSLFVRGTDEGGHVWTKTLDVPVTAPLRDILAAVDRAHTSRRHVATFDDWIEEYAVAKDLRTRSVTALRQALRGLSLDDARNASAVARLQTSSYAPATKRAYMQRIRAFYTWLRSRGVDVMDPTDGRKIPRVTVREYSLTPEDAARLIAHVDAVGSIDDRLFVRLLRYTGARCSTVAALTREDVERTEDGGVYLHYWNVKCGRRYAVPIHVTDEETIRLLEASALWTDDPDRLHGRLYDRMRSLFGNGTSPHALRHLFASELLQRGVALDVISRLLDHSDIAITLKTYARHDQKQLDQALKELNHD